MRGIGERREKGEKKERKIREGDGAEREKYSQWTAGGQTDRKKRGAGCSV